MPTLSEEDRATAIDNIIVVQYELYELYDWGKVLELYGTLQWTWNSMELFTNFKFCIAG